MHRDIHHLLDWVTLWFLRNGEAGLDLGGHVGRFRDGIQSLSQALEGVLPPHYLADRKVRAQPYVDQGVPEALAFRIAGLVNLFSGCDIVSLATRRGLAVPRVAKLYFAVGTRFGLGRLRAAAEGIDLETHWQRLAVEALIEEIYGHQLALSGQVLDVADGKLGPRAAIDGWSQRNGAAVEQTEHLLGELRSTAITDISMVAVASRQLRALTSAAGD
jgi:glutamate dehydrogenase